MDHGQVELLAEAIRDCCRHSRLRCWRLARGWDEDVAVAALNARAAERGVRGGYSADAWLSWELGKRNPPPALVDVVCEVMRTGPVQLGFARDYTPDLYALDRDTSASYSARMHGGRLDPPREMPVRRVLVLAADGAAGLVEDLLVEDARPDALENLHARLARLARQYVTMPPGPCVVGLDRLRRACVQLLERRCAHALDVHADHGAVCVLLSNAALDVGDTDRAVRLAEAAADIATVIGHPVLRGWARGAQALALLVNEPRAGSGTTYRPADVQAVIDAGLHDLPRGPGAARLHALRARAAATAPTGRDVVEVALESAEAALTEPPDVLAEVGGEFAFSEAKRAYYAGDALLRLADGHRSERALRVAEHAVQLYETDGPEASYGCQALARIQLARGIVGGGEIGAAETVLQPVLALPPEQRLASITANLARLDTQLPGCRGSRDLRTAIHDFRASTLGT